MTWFAIAVIALVSYTFGAKAGRKKYREIRATVDAIWNDPRIKRARRRALKQAQKVGA